MKTKPSSAKANLKLEQIVLNYKEYSDLRHSSDFNFVTYVLLIPIKKFPWNPQNPK